jgi:hypothetical protein
MVKMVDCKVVSVDRKECKVVSVKECVGSVSNKIGCVGMVYDDMSLVLVMNSKCEWYSKVDEMIGMSMVDDGEYDEDWDSFLEEFLEDGGRGY